VSEKPRTSTVWRGATMRFAIYAQEINADLSGMSCVAAMRKLPPASIDVDPMQAVAASAEGEFFSAANGRGPGWYLTFPSTETRALNSGARYLLNVRVTSGSDVYFSRSRIIEVREPGVQP
jgi:hypothetical protein